MPCFSSDADTLTYIAKYVVVGVSLHLRRELKAGHSNVALSEQLTRMSKRCTVYVSKDDSPIQKVLSTQHDVHSGGYTVGFGMSS